MTTAPFWAMCGHFHWRVLRHGRSRLRPVESPGPRENVGTIYDPIRDRVGDLQRLRRKQSQE